MEYTIPVLCLLGVILVVGGSQLHTDKNDDLADIRNPFASRQKRAATSCYGNKCGTRNTGSTYSSNRNTASSYSSNRNTGTNYDRNYNNRCTHNCRSQGYSRPASGSSYSSASSSSYSQGNAYGSASASAGNFNPAAFFNAISGRTGFGCYSGNCPGGNNFGYIPPEFFTGQGYFDNFQFPAGFNFPVYPPNNGVSVTSRVRSNPGNRGKGVWAGSSISTQNGKVTSYRAGTGRF